MTNKQPEHAVADALRKVARRIDEELGDGLRSWKIDAEDLLQTLLSVAAKVRIPVAQIEEDIQSGAPTNPDGTLNLMQYAAWLVKGMGRGS